MRPASFIWPEILRSTTLRWSLVLASAFAVCTLLSFGFVYWHTAVALTVRVDTLLNGEADVMATYSPAERLEAIDARVRQDPHRIKLTGLFAADGHRLAGNLERLPPGLEPSTPARDFLGARSTDPGHELQVARMVARRLPDGSTLALARNIDELGIFARTLERALLIAMFPALGFAVLASVFLTLRAQRRVKAVTSTVARIVAGDLRERLPTRGVEDPFDQLASIVNGMLGEIETLMQQVAQVGNDIAHDLRTPLTRVRASLERARDNARTLEELQAVVDRAIVGLDKSLAIITALLRIAEIEHGRRLAGFGEVDLADLVQEVAELYAPMAEDKGQVLRAAAAPVPKVRGDRDLLFEAIANLVDNAVKFTPAGGTITLSLALRGGGPVIRVTDTGPGIAPAEREAVTRPFYRSDKSRSTHGTGLGLSLVAAIAKLHGYELVIGAGPGGVVEIAGAPLQAAAASGAA